MPAKNTWDPCRTSESAETAASAVEVALSRAAACAFEPALPSEAPDRL